MITASIETLSDCLDEMKPLFARHWEEIAIFKDVMPLAPDYADYYRREEAGHLVIPVLRKDGNIIGYWPTFVTPGLHYKTTLTAHTDILYIAPEHRGDGCGKMLFDCLKAELARRGVKVWYAGSKNHKQIEWFLKLLGFDPVETIYAMRLDGVQE